MESRFRKKEAAPALAGYKADESVRAPFVTGFLERGGRSIPVVATSLSRRDVVDGWKVRWDIGRGRYTVLPGLYAVGEPRDSSPILVSANYKLSFDALRKELAGLDAWILVLDTKGVNVWCAAGKGSFGTAELLDKIARLRLGDIVSHNLLILPQLGAPGVSGPEIARLSTFRVVWGPVRAADIPAFLERGMKKDDAMREVRFDLPDRMAIAPVELAHAWPLLAASIAIALAAALPAGPGYAGRLLGISLTLMASVLAGTLAFPALLPFLPFRSFALKGALLGVLCGALGAVAIGAGPALGASLVLVCAPVAAFLALNFTGASTYTSQPGANLEVERGFLPMVASLVIGLGLGAAARLFGL